jgi:hypothetical protein
MSCESLLLSAFQMPGWVNDINPTTMTLNSGLLYHRVKRETRFTCVLSCSISGSMAFSDMMRISRNKLLIHSRSCRILHSYTDLPPIHAPPACDNIHPTHAQHIQHYSLWSTLPKFWRSMIRQAYSEHPNGLAAYGVIHLFDETMLSEKSLKPSLRCPAWSRQFAKGRSAKLPALRLAWT